MKSFIDLSALMLSRLLVLLLALLPERTAMSIANVVVRFGVMLVPRFRRVALRNLEIAFPELSLDRRREIFSDSLGVLARNLYSFATLERLSLPLLRSCVVNWKEFQEKLERIRAKNTAPGLIVTTAHFGSFELLAQAYTILYKPLSILARGFGLERLDEWWNGRRELHGAEIFSRKGAYREIIERLQRGHDVALLVDQNVKQNHATFVPFFGLKAATTRAVALASLQSGASVIFATAVEISPWKFRALLVELEAPEPGLPRSEWIECLSADLNRAIESAIREYPSQWFWVHRRWKTRPPGESETIYGNRIKSSLSAVTM